MSLSIYKKRLFGCLSISVWASSIMIADHTFEAAQIIPQSPSAAQMMSYVDRPVTLYSGTVGVSVPLCEVKAYDITLPLSLSYGTTGFVPSQEATWVGLGWNFSLNACISRVIKCKDDFATAGEGYLGSSTDIPYFANSQELIDIHAIESDANGWTAIKDLERDIFSYSFWGGGSKFVLDRNSTDGECVLFENTQGWKMKVVSIDGSFSANNSVGGTYFNWFPHYFDLMSPDGDIYQFHNIEMTQNYSHDNRHSIGSDHAFVSGWYLSSIISKTGHVVTFNYVTEYYKSPIRYSSQYATRRDYSGIGNSMMRDFEGPLNTESSSLVRTYRLESISWDCGRIEFKTSSREDLCPYDNREIGKRLDGIKVYLHGKLVKNFGFEYGYFGANVSTSENAYLYKRLKLKAVRDLINTDIQYSFSYDESESFPSKSTTATDYWGYYNGQNYGTSPCCRFFDISDGKLYEGAVKYSNFAKTKLGTLSTMVHPTGGVERFKYQLNEFDWYNQLDAIETIVDATDYINYYSGMSVLPSKTYIFTFPETICIDCNWSGYFNSGTISTTQPLFSIYVNGVLSYSPNISVSNGNGTASYTHIIPAGKEVRIQCYKPANWSGGISMNIKTSHKRDISALFFDQGLVRGAGLRIASIEGGGKTRTFSYEKGTLMVDPVLGYHVFHAVSGPNYVEFLVQSSESLVPLSSVTKGHLVGYHNVTETCGSQKTDYHYYMQKEEHYDYNDPDNEIFMNFQKGDIPFLSSKPNFMNGLLIQSKTHDLNANTYSVTTNMYEPKKSGLINAIYFVRSHVPVPHHYTIDWELVKQTSVSGSGIVNSSTSYSYYDNLLVKEQTQVADNHTYTTKYSYTTDDNSSTSRAMVDRNMILPVEVQQFVDNHKVSGNRIEYGYDNKAGTYLPKRVYAYNSKTSLELLMHTYTKYDKHGNVLEIIKTGIPTSYIWSYNGMYPIAEISNAYYNDIQSKLNKNLDAICDSFAPTADDMAKIQALNTAPGIQVTTLTYEPMLGVKSMSGPIGKTIYFDYEKGQLKRKYYLNGSSKDIIEEYEYNISNQ